MSDTVKPSNDGRDRSGRFGLGNRFARGRPPSSIHAAEMRHAFRSAITAADIAAATKKLVASARAGNLDACRELLDRVIGRPVAQDWTEEIETIKLQIQELMDRIAGKHAA